MLCGRYEGVDERVREHWSTEELSIGDYVLTRRRAAGAGDRRRGGAAGAGRGRRRAVGGGRFVRARAARLPALHAAGGVPRAWTVPDVLLSGHHGEIRALAAAARRCARTLERRPDLLADAALDEEEQEILRELMREREKGARS